MNQGPRLWASTAKFPYLTLWAQPPRMFMCPLSVPVQGKPLLGIGHIQRTAPNSKWVVNASLPPLSPLDGARVWLGQFPVTDGWLGQRQTSASSFSFISPAFPVRTSHSSYDSLLALLCCCHNWLHMPAAWICVTLHYLYPPQPSCQVVLFLLFTPLLCLSPDFFFLSNVILFLIIFLPVPVHWNNFLHPCWGKIVAAEVLNNRARQWSREDITSCNHYCCVCVDVNEGLPGNQSLLIISRSTVD